MASALVLVQDIGLGLELGVRRDRAGSRQNLAALHLFTLGAAKQRPDIVARFAAIEQLAERSTFLEVAYLLLNGELPTQSELDEFVHEITYHTYVHENIRTVMNGFRYDAHAMSMLISSVAALGTFYPEARDVHDAENRRLQIHRLVAKMPTLAAFTYRHHQGLPPAYPANELSYAANFLNMLFRIGGDKYKVNPAVERALDILFILHADHEQNCSTTAMRVIGSSEAGPYPALSGAMGALFGPLHGGANEAVLRML